MLNPECLAQPGYQTTREWTRRTDDLPPTAGMQLIAAACADLMMLLAAGVLMDTG
jgi:hypothetical protein